MHTCAGWTSPILSDLKDGRLPPNPKEAKKIQKRAARFTVLYDELYKRGFSQPYLRCVEEEEAKYVPEEVYGGIYSDHMGAKSLTIVKKCDSCQTHKNIQRVPGEKMTAITSPWPFAQ